MLMEIKYELTEIDIEEFVVQHTEITETSQYKKIKNNKITYALFSVFVACYIMVSDYIQFHRFTLYLPVAVGFLVIAVLWFFFYERFFFWRVRGKIRRLLCEGNKSIFIGEHRIELVDQNLKWIHNGHVIVSTKPFIENVIETGDYILYCVITGAFIVIPKRAFSTEHDLVDFKVHFARYLIEENPNQEKT